MKEETKDLKYWKLNAEEDYIKTPISVLRYISELEQAKEMDKEQMINFGFKIAEEANNLIEPTVEPYEKSEIEERFYNQIFKSE